jgi:DNA repair protein RecN (Recombination protein N)
VLTHIQIRDFAIIDAVELELDAGLTVLTGETGAGKSILVDALLLAAGGRAGAEVVRHGCERAEVAATFSLSGNDAALAWLADQAIEHEGECQLRRIVSADGRSRAYVNGQAMPVQSLRQLGELLVEVHGQMEYQSLVRRAAQRTLLDRHGEHEELLAKTASAFKELSALREERERVAAATLDREARLELLEYHLNELNALALKPNEIEELTAERKRLSQSGRLAAGAREIMALLRETEGANAEHTVSRALTIARQLQELDAALAATTRLLDESLIALREAVAAVEHYESELDADPRRQEWVEQRLAEIEALARKHRVEPAELPNVQAELSRELVGLTGLETSLHELDARLAAARQAFESACAKLSAARKRTAAALSERVTGLMQTLGMPGGQFSIAIEPLPNDAANQHGADDIEFLVTANPGQPLRPLAKVASGGELSRISLAIQVAAAQNVNQPCLVFDEVDAGVGGAVAEIVGRQLRTLGERTQVLCVTHLPQVASQAHAHVRVTKLTDGKSTRTSLRVLTHEERIEEIARMLGGVNITSKAREHATEMLRVGASAGKKRRGKAG